MNENTRKAHKAVMKECYVYAEKLAKCGMDEKQIVNFFQKQMECKESQFYARDRSLKPLKTIIASLKKDSKAEGIFYDWLKEQGFNFKFQYKVGNYRIDFLLNDFLAVELDGPYHERIEQKIKDEQKDRYLESMGFELIRVPLWLFSTMPEVIFKEINEILENYKNKEKKSPIKIKRI